MEYIIEPTKTSYGKRVLLMTPDVYECFQTILKNRRAPKKEPMVGKYVGFLYLDKNGMPMVHYIGRSILIISVKNIIRFAENRYRG